MKIISNKFLTLKQTKTYPIWHYLIITVSKLILLCLESQKNKQRKEKMCWTNGPRSIQPKNGYNKNSKGRSKPRKVRQITRRTTTSTACWTIKSRSKLTATPRSQWIQTFIWASNDHAATLQSGFQWPRKFLCQEMTMRQESSWSFAISLCRMRVSLKTDFF